MEWIVTTGKTVAEAVERALDELGVDEADIEYEVLEEPKRGFLSRLGGGSPTRIKARVKPLSREKPDRRRRGGSRDRDRERKSSGEGSERAGRPPRAERAPADRPPAERSGSGRPARGRPPSGADQGEDGPAEDTERRPAAERSGAGERERSASGSGSASRNRRRTKKPQGATAVAKAATPETSSKGEEEEAVSGSEVTLEEQAEMAEAFARGLIERFGLPGTVNARAEGDDDVMVDVEGTDLGLLIGPRAATIDAVQELVRTAVQRRIGGHGARIHVDVAGYRARRQEALAEFARQAAQRALESGRDQVFEPMSPVDRKIVHDIVNEIEGVATISEGEEPRRRVIIKALASTS
jgi:spoIIIJ-associated protein